MSPEDGVRPRNDFFRLADQIIEENPEYTKGAEAVKTFIAEATQMGYLPKEVVLKPETDSIPPSQRTEVEEDPVYHHMWFDFDPNQRRVTLIDGQTNNLTKRESQLLEFLTRNPNRVISREEIIESVFGPSEVYDYNFLKIWMSRVRNKLPFWAYKREHSVIKTYRNTGYEFYDPSKIREAIAEREEEKIIEIPQVREVVVYQHRLFKFVPSIGIIEAGERKFRLPPILSRFLETLSNEEFTSTTVLLDLLPKDKYTDTTPNIQSIRVHVARLRSRLREDLGINEEIIETIGGRGYRLIP